MSAAPLIKRFLGLQDEFIAYLMAITRSFPDAEEIFQNAALVIIEKDAEGVEVRDFRAWAKEIVRRQALYYFRKETQRSRQMRPLQPRLLEQIDRSFSEDATSDANRNRELQALEDCIGAVPESQREMLALRYERRASFEDIARRVGKTDGAVQRALSRLRRSLHDCVRSKIALTDA